MENTHPSRPLLKQLPLFSDFTELGMSQLLSAAQVKHYSKDHHLFMHGAKASTFFLVIKGWVKLYRQTRDGHEFILALLTRGHIFGKEALIQHNASPYSAQTTIDTELVQWPASSIIHMAKNHGIYDHFCQRLIESDVNEINHRHLQAEHATYMTSAQRIGCFLLKHSNKKIGQNTLSLQLPYEKSLIATQLGMPPETFSRALNQLSALGVETKGSTITIHNAEQLAHHICNHCSAINNECNILE